MQKYIQYCDFMNSNLKMAGNEEERVQIRASLKAQSCFNNYPKWKEKVKIQCCLVVQILSMFDLSVCLFVAERKLLHKGQRRSKPPSLEIKVRQQSATSGDFTTMT